MLHKKSIKLAVFLIIVFYGFSNISGQRVLSLDQAVELALENNKDLLIAQLELEYAEAQINEAYGAAYPVIGANLGSSHTNKVRTMRIPAEDGVTEIPMGNRNNYFANINVTQPIWVGGKVGAALEGAKLFKGFMGHNVEHIKRRIIYITKLSYYGALLSNAYVDIFESALSQAEKHFAQVRDMYGEGMASRFDMLRAEVAVSNARPAFLQAKNGHQMDLVRLKKILGIDLDEELSLSDELVYIPFEITEEEGVLSAMQNREDLKALELEINMNEILIRINKADYYPSLFFNAEYNMTRDRSASSNIYGEASAGFLLRWSFDFGTKGRIRQSDVRMRQSIHKRAQILEDIKYEVKEAFIGLQEAESIILSQEKVIEMAQEALQIAEVRYQSGTGTHLEVTDAQFSLNQAKTNYIHAMFDFIIARATVEKVIGIL